MMFQILNGDISSIQSAVVGNPMYDPVGMLVALVAMDSPPLQIQNIANMLSTKTSLLDAKQRVAAMMAAYNGEVPDRLAQRYMDTSNGIAKATAYDSRTRVAVNFLLTKHIDIYIYIH